MNPIDYAKQIVTQPGFDGLHDPNKATALIEPYHDDAGFPTIGYGHLLSRERWAPLLHWAPITVDEAERLLEQDLAKALRSVARLCPVPLQPWQAGALTDFAFNLGAGNLEISTLRRKVNRGDIEGAADEFPKWNRAGGRVLRGLVRRCAVRRQMFLG